MRAFLIALTATLTLGLPHAAGQVFRTVSIVQDATIHRVEDAPLLRDPDGYVQRFEGQVIDRVVDLPPPSKPVDARRVMVRLKVTPITSFRDGRRRPNDPWNRLGSVAVIGPPPPGGGRAQEVELMRFVTGYGGGGLFEQDVTALAPLLTGRRTIRLFISSYSDLPGWTVSLELVYSTAGVGFRRPDVAVPLFNDQHVTGDIRGRIGRLKATVEIPQGLSLPRLRIISTGHASDGTGRNEFVTSNHILKVDGHVVARWRPWSEDGGTLRDRNPWAGRRMIDGREIWASDFDRSGWHPGAVVDPMMIPLPEPIPGRHTIELEIRGIRAATEEDPAHGFWVVSGVVVADEPWEEGD